jgi:hypothetical protein
MMRSKRKIRYVPDGFARAVEYTLEGMGVSEAGVVVFPVGGGVRVVELLSSGVAWRTGRDWFIAFDDAGDAEGLGWSEFVMPRLRLIASEIRG